MRALIITLILLIAGTCVVSGFSTTSPRNQYYIPGVAQGKSYALLHLTSNDEDLVQRDTMLLVNFRNTRQLDFILDHRPERLYQKIILTDGLKFWESKVFEAFKRNTVAYRLRVENGELKVVTTYRFFMKNFIEYLGAVFILLFVIKGFVYWMSFRKKTKFILGRFTAAQVRASIIISIGMVILLTIIGSAISVALYVLLMLVVSALMFLWELKMLDTSILSKKQHFSLMLISNLAWFVIATYPLMGMAPSL